MHEISPAITDRIAGLAQGSLLIAEAGNGFALMAPYLDALPAGARVLEVGSGAAILLAQLTQSYPHVAITGLEPIGAGFAFAEATLDRLTQTIPFDLRRVGYEGLTGDERFDLIFSINVFEHLPDWRDFLRFTAERLTPTGRCVIYCPNYGLPYESHFSLPIIASKALTRRIFRRRIEEHERDRNALGLWDSLNFVTWGQVSRALGEHGLEARFDSGIMDHMVGRLDSDPEFRTRQAGVASLARAVRRSGILRIMRLPAFWNLYPYMHLDLRRTSA